MKSLAVLGSTGSIGTQTLDIVRANPDLFQVAVLGASSSVEALASQAVEFSPEVVAIADLDKAAELKELLPAGTELLAGPEAAAQAALTAQTVVNGVVGFEGLPVTLATLKAGKRLALANKESLIAAGPLVQKVRHAPGAELLPVDSEHCAVHQCLNSASSHPNSPSSHSSQQNSPSTQLEVTAIEGTTSATAGGAASASGAASVSSVSRIILTASGGPFRGCSRDELETATIQDALAHPTWSMGPKITVDSSTLMNKGLEVIEAHELFGFSYSKIDVVVHPQSIVHSMVEFIDGATIAQLSLPDMRLCIGYAISFPQRLPQAFGQINWQDLQSLDFEEPDWEAFPCLGLAFAAGREGETAPAALNAANEVAVQAFLDGKIRWLDISAVIEAALDKHDNIPATEVEDILDADRQSRLVASEIIESYL